MSTLTSKEFREKFAAELVSSPCVGKINRKVLDDELAKAEKLNTKDLLRLMGAYFELDPKKVNFWIRQMELDKKI